MDQLLELFRLITSASSFTYLVILTMVGLIFWFMTDCMKMPGLATLFAPILVLSGLVGNYFANGIYSISTNDQDANVAIYSSIGVLLGLLVLITSCFVWITISELKAKRIEGRNIALAKRHDR